jgi:WD40 repeat protein
LLATRLARRGATLSAGLLAALLGDLTSAAEVPAVLLVQSLNVAITFNEPTSGAVSVHVAHLVKRTLANLTQSSIKFSIVLACCLGLVGMGVATYQFLDARSDEPGGASPAVPQATSEPRVAAQVDCFGDPLPAGALARMGTVRQWYGRLSFPPKTVFAFSPDDKTVVSQNYERMDGAVCLWDAATGREIRWIANASTGVVRWPNENNLLALAPDGKTLAKVNSGAKGDEGTVYLWEVTTGKLLHKLRKSQVFKRLEGFCGITFLPSGKILTLDGVNGDYRIYLWDVATGGREISRLKGWGKDPDIESQTVTFSPDGKMMAAVENSKAVDLWEVATGKKVCQLQLVGEGIHVNSLAFSPDSKTLAAGGSGFGAICVWDVVTGKPIHRFKAGGGAGSVDLLTYSPDGRTLLGGEEGRLWDLATGKEIRSFGWKDAKVAVFSHNGKLVATGDKAGVIRLWDTITGKEIHPHHGHQESILSVAYSPDGRTLASVTVGSWNLGDQAIRLWEIATGKEIRQLGKRDTWGYGSVAYSPDGKILVSMDNRTIYLWDTASGKEIRRFRERNEDPRGAIFSPDGKLLAATLGGHTICLWQVATGKRIYTLPSEHSSAGQSWSVVFSPDGWMLAAPGKDGTIDLWEVATGKSIGPLRLKQDGREIRSLAFSPDGRILATSSSGQGHRGRQGHREDDKAHLWEVATGKEIGQLEDPKASWNGE